MFTSLADGLLRGMLRELFCTDLNLSPEDCFNGKIILIDLPVKEYQELGQLAQGLFKYVRQRAVERRVPAGTKREEAQEKIRPVFLWADESQFFVNQYDAMFQSTARSSRACNVYLTQNLPGYHTAFGNSRGAAEAFLGNLQTKIFHANGDLDTNNWASNSIGRIRQIQTQGGLSDGAQPKSSNQNAGGSMVFEFIVQAQEFTVLRTGGDDKGLECGDVDLAVTKRSDQSRISNGKCMAGRSLGNKRRTSNLERQERRKRRGGQLRPALRRLGHFSRQ